MPGTPVPQGEQETLGVGKEITFGTLPTLSLWHPFNKHDPQISTAEVERAPRASLGYPLPGTGGRSVAMSLDVETAADTFPQWLALTLGAQSTPTTTLVNTTLAATMATGATTATLTSTIGVFTGMVLTIGADTLTVKGISGLNQVTFTAGAATQHASATAVTNTTVGAYLTVMKLGTPLPSFSMEVNRPGSVCSDYLGCAVDQLALSIGQGQQLGAKLSLVAQDTLTQGSPTTATLSTLNPYIYEQQNTYAQIGGEVTGLGSAASLISLQLNISNNLIKNWFTFGGGNRVRAFVEQIRKCTGTITLGFETAAQLNNMNAARTGGALPPISVLIPFVSTDFIGATGLNYAFFVYLPKVFLNRHSIADDTRKATMQTIGFSCGESAPSANDQVTIYSINSNSAIY